MNELRRMIDEAHQTRLEHKAARRYIDAAAAAIREKALTDALKVVMAG